MRGKSLFHLTLFLLVVLLLPSSFSSAARASATQPDDCTAALSARPGWQSELLDPTLPNDAALQTALSFYYPIYFCLAALPLDQQAKTAGIRKDIQTFLTFAGGYGIQAGQRATHAFISFQGLKDPAVSALHGEAGLPDPDGYIFLWFFSSVSDMPANIQELFQQPSISGVTTGTRYIALLSPSPELEAQNVTSNRGFTRIISHELVHAFLNLFWLRQAGSQQVYHPPLWYSEGLATYFSQASPLARPGGISFELGKDPYESEQYQRYLSIFQYLNRKLGHPLFMEQVGQSVRQQNPALLYQQVGAKDVNQLLATIEAEEESQQRLVTILVGVLVGALLLSAIFQEHLLGILRMILGGIANAVHLSATSVPNIDLLKANGDFAGLSAAVLYEDEQDLHETHHICHQAATALVEGFGSESAPLFLDILQSPNGSYQLYIQQVACEMLGRLQEPRAVELLTGFLNDEHLHVSAALALARIGDPFTFHLLFKRVFDADGQPDENYITALLYWKNQEWLEQTLLRDLGSPNSRVKVAACILLGELRSRSAVPGLIQILTTEGRHQAIAARALAEIGERQSDPCLTRYLLSLSTGDLAAWIQPLKPAARTHVREALTSAYYESSDPASRVEMIRLLNQLERNEHI